MLTVKLILERLDKEGRLLERREQLSKSFVQNFIALLYCAHAQVLAAAPYVMTDIDGNPQDVDSQCLAGSGYSKGNLRIAAAPGEACEFIPYGAWAAMNMLNIMLPGEHIGIQVGTGIGAVTPANTSLGTRIVHGRGGGQLEYGGCEIVGLTLADPNGEFTIRRYFTNLSGGPITVEEVGIHSVGSDHVARAAWAFLIARDLTGGVAVANTEILRATYVAQITV